MNALSALFRATALTGPLLTFENFEICSDFGKAGIASCYYRKSVRKPERAARFVSSMEGRWVWEACLSARAQCAFDESANVQFICSFFHVKGINIHRFR